MSEYGKASTGVSAFTDGDPGLRHLPLSTLPKACHILDRLQLTRRLTALNPATRGNSRFLDKLSPATAECLLNLFLDFDCFMPTIRQLIYISKATQDFSGAELQELAAVAAQNNELHGITGALLFIDNCFIQVIEGEETVMSDLLTRLEADPRHSDIRIISDHLQDCRYFADWSMGLLSPPDEEKPKIVRELRSVSTLTDGKTTSNAMPLPNTVAMMQRLYETDSVLQQARH